MRWRGLAAGVTSALLLLLLAGPASADAKGRIVGIQPQSGQLKVTFSVAGLEPGQTVDPAGLSLTLEGSPLKVTSAVAASAATTHVARRVILAIDTSGSMAGPGIAGARAAAAAYLAKVPADVSVGLIGISTQAHLLVPLSTNRARIRAAVAGLQANGNTALYDALALALRNLPQDGDRQILLLSDGADDGSRTSLAQITGALSQGKASLDAVAFRTAATTNTLGQLTAAAGGRVISVQQAAGLSAAFTEAATNDNQVVLTADIPASFTASQGTIVVSGSVAGQSVTDSALAAGLLRSAPKSDLTLEGPKPANLGPAFLRSSATLYLALLAMFAGLVFLLITAVTTVRGGGGMSRRMAIYTLSGRGRVHEPIIEDGRNAVTRSVMDAADKIVKDNDLEAKLGQRLDAGGIPLRPAEWLLLHLGIAVLVPLFVLVITSADLVPTLLALFLAALGPWGYLAFKKRQRTRAFLAQLPDVLQLMSGSLSAGYSLPQAIDAVFRQGNEPVATEFNKALVEARIGAPIEDALDDVATRMESVDFHWVVMAIRIQREVGGNLSEILATVAATLRERERLRRQVQVLSAEGKLSAYILGGLPVMFALYLLLTKPAYLLPLVTDPIGWILLVGMIVLMAVGSFWMKKVVTVDV